MSLGGLVNKIKLSVLLLIISFGILSSVWGQTPIYTQDFSATYPVGWTKTYTGSGNDWEYYNTGYAFNGSYCMGYASNEYAANAWVFMQGISMTAGYTYRLEFYQRVLSNTPNNLKITIGTAQTIAAQTTVLLDSLNLVNTVYLNRVSSNFTPTVTGTYNFAFNCYSSPLAGLLLVDNVRVYETVPPLPDPLSFTATPVSCEQIDLAWTKFSPTDNIMVAYNTINTFGTPVNGTSYSVGNSITGGGTVIYNSGGANYNHPLLLAHTTYYYKIWSVGEPLLKSPHYDITQSIVYSTGLLANATTFRTPVSVPQGSPFTESFDAVSFPPMDWITMGVTKGRLAGDWLRYTTGTNPPILTHSGSGMAGYNSYVYASGVKGVLVTPPLNLPSEGYKVQFWMYRDSYNNLTNSDLVNVYYNTSDNLAGATRLGTIYRYTASNPAVAGDGWYQYAFSLPSGSGGNYRYVIFEGVSAYGNNMFVDDVQILYDPPLPVELSSFYAVISVSNHALLTWITQSETNLAGFRIYRGTSNNLATAQMADTYIQATNTSQQQIYVFHDTEPWTNGTYYYWLEAANLDGTNTLHGPVSIALDFDYHSDMVIPLTTEISSVFPNPFNPSTTITYSLDHRSDVEITIYNARGQKIRQLVKGNRTPGNYKVTWNGTDEANRACSSGSYLIVMHVGKEVYTSKAVLLK